MRNTLIIGGICILVLVLGGWLYFVSTRPVTKTPSTTGVSASNTKPEQKEISFRVLDQGANAKNMPARKNYAIYDAGEFTTFWKKAHGTDGKSVPTIDFSKNYVIGVFAGTEPSGGYSISVSHVTEAGSARSVTVLIEEPGDNCTVIEEQTSPYEFVLVPFSDADALAHTDMRTKTTCPSPL
jgi:hypothetical protein